MKRVAICMAALLLISVYGLQLDSAYGVLASSDEADPIVDRQLGSTATAHALLYPYEYVGSAVGHAFSLQCAVGDVDRDGNADAVLPSLIGTASDWGKGDTVAGEIIVAFGDGTGAFGRFTRVFSGDPVTSLLLGDFNRDEWPDILFLSSIPDEQGVPVPSAILLLGDSEGDFQHRIEMPLGEVPLGLLSADFNNDALPDIAYLYLTQEKGFQAIEVLIGNGLGGFTPQEPQVSDRGILSIDTCHRVIDVDQDGLLDVVGVGGAAVTDTWLWIAYGLPSGRFEYEWLAPTGKRLPLAIETGDFDGDGLHDIAIAFPWDVVSSLNHFQETGQGSAFPTDSSLVVLYGESNRGWAISEIDSGCQPIATCVTDINSDGITDLLAFGQLGNVGIACGGEFGLQQQAAVFLTMVPGQIATVFAGDFTGDGLPDVGVQSTVGTVVVRNGDGFGGLEPGWFAPPIDSRVPFGKSLVEDAVDFDQDGNLDLVFYDEYAGAGIAYGIGDGRFTDAGSLFSLTRGSISDVAVGDFDGDGYPDIAIAEVGREGDVASRVWLLRGLGNRYFIGATEPAYQSERSIRDLVPVDIGNDMILDIIAVPILGIPRVLRGGVKGGLGYGSFFDFPYEGYSAFSNPQLGDFNNDGFGDLLCQAFYEAVGDFTILWFGDDSERFTVAATLPALYLAGVGDADADGFLDFAAFDVDGDRNWIFHGDGTGAFEKRPALRTKGLDADLNRDNLPDGVACNGAAIGVELGSLNGAPLRAALFANQGHPDSCATSFVIGDFNSDGWDDLATTNGSYVSVLLSRLDQRE